MKTNTQLTDQLRDDHKIRNDVQLLDQLRAEGWEILGAGFKTEDSFTAKDINEKLWSEVIPWFHWAFFPCISDAGMFWLATKEN